MKKSGLEKKVEDESCGSWIVVERWRESIRASNEGRNDDFRGLAGGSRFAVLGFSEGEISAVFNGEINGSDEVVTKKKSSGEGDIGLGFPKKDVIGTTGK
ncbi:hypothetical protein Goklo_029414 [Gossypium klotzschianum]|uniref:Uncharacterized protein n=1 Tax=Gossypium klotzschianum TaxID=34286 RepID=A0A7J8WG28_9ROSI|nr:hypothetical protein [Gossypium klotzschianum]